jgi:predicted Fe-Mo cluster-binding NifX family protein
MKVIVTAQGQDLESEVSPRFGRAPWFLLVDVDSGSYEAIANDQNLAAPQGAGIQAAQTVVRTGARAVLTGNCGPKAFRTLTSSGLAVYVDVAGRVSEVLSRYRAGELDATSQPNVAGHWS